MMTLQVNQQLVLEIPVEGAPAPETVWLKDDAEVKSDDVIRVSHAANCAKLMFIPARRFEMGLALFFPNTTLHSFCCLVIPKSICIFAVLRDLSEPILTQTELS